MYSLKYITRTDFMTRKQQKNTFVIIGVIVLLFNLLNFAGVFENETVRLIISWSLIIYCIGAAFFFMKIN